MRRCSWARVGPVFQLSRASLAADFRTGDGRYLFIAAEPGDPRLYMLARPVRELEKASEHPSAFLLALRKHLGGAVLRDLTKDDGDRVVRFSFAARDAVGDERERTLVAQLTAPRAHLFCSTTRAGRRRAEHAHGAGQETGQYAAPLPGPPRRRYPLEHALSRGSFARSRKRPTRTTAARTERRFTRHRAHLGARRSGRIVGIVRISNSTSPPTYADGPSRRR